MSISRYISELEPIAERISNIPKLRHEVDLTTELLISKVLKGNISTYQLCKYLKDIKQTNHHYSIAYKNVHKKVQKLLNLGLIEEEKPPEGGNKHGAINYKLSTFGLIYLFSQGLFYGYNDIYTKYFDNIILETLVLSLFERRTVVHGTQFLRVVIATFLEECCARTRAVLSGEPEGLWSTGSGMIGMEGRLHVLKVQLNWMVRTFVTKLCLSPMLSELSGRLGPPDETEVDRTYDLLSRDKKFMYEVKNIATDFNNSYLRLKQLSRKKT